MLRASRYSSASGAVTGIVPCNLTTRPPFSRKLEMASTECMFCIPKNRGNWTLTNAPQKPDGGGRGGRVLPVLGSPLGEGAPSTREHWLSLRRETIGLKAYGLHARRAAPARPMDTAIGAVVPIKGRARSRRKRFGRYSVTVDPPLIHAETERCASCSDADRCLALMWFALSPRNMPSCGAAVSSTPLHRRTRADAASGFPAW